MGAFWARSIFGTKTRKGLVELRHDDWSLMVDVPTARKIGLDILEAAEIATQDAFLFEFISTKMEAGDDAAAAMVAELRQWREERGKDYGRGCDHSHGTEGPADAPDGKGGSDA